MKLLENKIAIATGVAEMQRGGLLEEIITAEARRRRDYLTFAMIFQNHTSKEYDFQVASSNAGYSHGPQSP